MGSYQEANERASSWVTEQDIVSFRRFPDSGSPQTSESEDEMIEKTVEKWIDWAKGTMPGDRAESLDTLLADASESRHRPSLIIFLAAHF